MIRSARQSRGFTLIEVLVAIAILLIGVVMALLIFPRGFDAFTEAQQSETALKQMDAWVREYQQHPEGLPDGIFPVDWSSADAETAARFFDFNDLTAIDYRANTATVFDWYTAHLYPSTTRVLDAGGNVTDVLTRPRWPFWQPTSLRMPRRVEGEKVAIPSGRSADVGDPLATVSADAAADSTTLTVSTTAKILYGMWLAVDDPPDGSIDGFVQVSFDNTDPLKTTGAALPSPTNVPLKASFGKIIRTGAVLRLFTPSAFVPKYLPRFGPIIPHGRLTQNGANFRYDWATIKVNAVDVPAPLTIYDTRYTKLPQDEFDKESDGLYYTVGVVGANVPDTTADAALQRMPLDMRDAGQDNTFVLLPSEDLRVIRLSFLTAGGAGVEAVTPTLITVPGHASGTPATTVNAPFVTPMQTSGGTNIDYNITLRDDACLIHLKNVRFVSGSEQLNRAYRFYDVITADEDPTSLTFNPANLNRYYAHLANMPSGCYYFPLNTHPSFAGSIVPGTVFFSREDSGRQVKMDYTVADWGTLHEDLTVNDEGYLTLAVPDPKLTDRPSAPRETRTWGLYGPMQNDGRDVMIGLVDTRTDMVYHLVNRNNPDYPFGIMPNSGVVVPQQVITIDTSQSQAGRLRLGGVPANVVWKGLWTNSTSINYQVNDGVQWNGAPYQCIKTNTPSGNPNDATEPGKGAVWQTCWTRIDSPDWQALRGSTFRIYYRARRDWALQLYKPPSVFWFLRANGGEDLKLKALQWRAFTQDPTTLTKLYLPGVYEGHTVAVDYYYRETPAPAEGQPRLLRASGELHTVPTREPGGANSLLVLQHTPETHAPITVRGASVAVRALWIQPHAGQSMILETDPGQPVPQTLNERWQAKTVMVTLPVTKK